MLKKHINAVKKTIKMWEWLRDNPGKGKFSYFYDNNISDKFTKNQCYLCYYWQAQKPKRKIYVCVNCPLCNKMGGCCNAYYEWMEASFFKTKGTKNRPKNAQIIINLCKDWLKKYKINEKKSKSMYKTWLS